MARIFYARVSTVEQNEARQITAAQEHGADKVFLDKLSGKDTNRPQLHAMLDYIREGDTVIVESYSRLSRDMSDLIKLVNQIEAKGADFVSLKENVDTTTPTGRLMFNMFASFAQFEREMMRQRQAEGIAEAKKNGVYIGRAPIAVDEKQFKTEVAKWRAGEQTAVATMKKLGLKPNSFYRKVKERGL